jgi:hypothetical protein
MYRNSQGFVKINLIITAPFPYARGVRQGDPLSGPLFSLTIKPFLLMCNRSLQKYGITVPTSRSTAYADDVTVFVTRNEGFPHLLHLFMVYGAFSGVTLNTQKTAGLFTGDWKKRTDHLLGFQWNTKGGEIPRRISRQHTGLGTTQLVRTIKQNQENTSSMDKDRPHDLIPRPENDTKRNCYRQINTRSNHTKPYQRISTHNQQTHDPIYLARATPETPQLHFCQARSRRNRSAPCAQPYPNITTHFPPKIQC